MQPKCQKNQCTALTAILGYPYVSELSRMMSSSPELTGPGAALVAELLSTSDGLTLLNLRGGPPPQVRIRGRPLHASGAPGRLSAHPRHRSAHRTPAPWHCRLLRWPPRPSSSSHASLLSSLSSCSSMSSWSKGSPSPLYRTLSSSASISRACSPVYA